MGCTTGFTVCCILFLFICLCTIAGTGSAYTEGDKLLLVNTIDRVLNCDVIYDCGWKDSRSYEVNGASSVSIRYLHDSPYGARGCPLIKLQCYDKNAWAPAGATVDFSGGQHPARCRAVRTDGYDCCKIEKMEIRCP